ncbi:MAG TPA: molybdopterin-dependent oxidoreductase, partial [Actinomycetota bacterium]|nr:molybdopterin-dependent oxidoreductase [Actinomycetota bacterium]
CVERALANVPFLVVQDLTLRGYEDYADAVLPASAFLEKDGHFTDWEGRGQRIHPVRQPPGLARPDWQIFQELSEVMGKDMGFRSLDHLWREMGELLAGQGRDEEGSSTGASPEEVVAQRAGGSRASSEGDATGDDTLTLFTYPLLVDEGRLSVDADELKAALEEQPFVEVHPEDAERLALGDGVKAVLRNGMGEATLPVRVSDGVAPGSAFVPWNQPGFRANEMFERGFTTSVTVEAAERTEEGAA